MSSKAVMLTAFAFLLPLGMAQSLPPARSYSTGFNSSFTLTAAQIEDAQLDNATVKDIETIMNFDRSQLAFGGPLEDDFYTLPPLKNTTGPLKAGQLLKVQPFTDPTAYSIPVDTALSRIIYTTTNTNGTVIPASGFILWPYVPRNGDDKASVVIWNHGTSGFLATQSPSTHRSLWYDDSAPFAIAEAGYAVFAPDFAGLGIGKSWDGSDIPHQYHASQTTAGDALFGFRAALEAFPDKLSSEFVAMGHSQGGGVAWGIAEVLASQKDKFRDLLPGYKGSIAGSPTTKVFANVVTFVLPPIGFMLDSIFPSFKLSDWLTPLGVARVNLAKDIQGSTGIWQQLFMTLSQEEVIQPDYNESWYIDAFSKLGDASRKDFAGPLLVLQGTEDTYVPYNITRQSVEDTWEMYPDHDLEILVASGVGHVPVLRATKHLWLQWIEDRFESKPVKKGSVRTDYESFLPIDHYLSTDTSFPGWAGLSEYSYQVPLAV